MILVFDILTAIDASQDESQEAVMESLFTTYDKALMILEYLDSDDISCFSIFQEAATDNDKEVSGKDKAKQGILKSIFGIIPKLIQRLKDLSAKNSKQRK